MEMLDEKLENLINKFGLLKVEESLNNVVNLNIDKKDVLNDPDSVIAFSKIKIGSLKYETFMVVFVNIKNEVLNYEIIAEGTIDQAIIYPRRVVEKALFHDAAGMIIFHNHPSGHCFPSKPDKIITSQLKIILNPIGIKLLDHIIVSKTDYYSFQEEGIL
jgi:DNA repair protein RadC